VFEEPATTRLSSYRRTVEDQERARTARANALRFAELAELETDHATKIYFRHIAVSWTRAAERHEFLLAMHDPELA
jgi:hypothetical protein